MAKVEELDLAIEIPPRTVRAATWTARLTQRNNAMLASGRHPATLTPLRQPPGETCGSCRFIVRHGPGTHTFLKCGLVQWTFGPGTDIRAKWAACEKWQPEEEAS